MATVDAELFECERYRVMVGWSADYLLPTDRHTYRVRGCTRASWRTLAEAELALLPPGWAWEEARDHEGRALGWEVDGAGPRADAGGWAYATGFTPSFEGGSPKGGMQMFARWRRLVRTQTFTGGPDALEAASSREAGAAARSPDSPGTACPNVDLQGAAHFGQLMLEALAMASLHGEWSALACVRLKWQLLDRLVSKKAEKNKIECLLADLVASQKSMASRVTQAFKTNDQGAVCSRIGEVGAQFPLVEREAYAAIAIRRFRQDLACRGECAPHRCPLRAVLCQHPGCNERFSANASEDHDRCCPFKPMQCEKCGELVPRGKLTIHAAAACPMREARCTFSAIGCNAALAHRDVPAHLQDCTQAHLMLLLDVVLEQQQVVRKLSSRVSELEEGARAQANEKDRAEAVLSEQVAALDSKLVALEKRSAQDVKKATDVAASDAKKKADAVASKMRTELDAVREDLTGVNNSLTELRRASAQAAAPKAEPKVRQQESS